MTVLVLLLGLVVVLFVPVVALFLPSLRRRDVDELARKIADSLNQATLVKRAVAQAKREMRECMSDTEPDGLLYARHAAVRHALADAVELKVSGMMERRNPPYCIDDVRVSDIVDMLPQDAIEIEQCKLLGEWVKTPTFTKAWGRMAKRYLKEMTEELDADDDEYLTRADVDKELAEILDQLERGLPTPPSHRQAAFINGLRIERDVGALADIDPSTISQATALIGKLLQCPRRPLPQRSYGRDRFVAVAVEFRWSEPDSMQSVALVEFVDGRVGFKWQSYVAQEDGDKDRRPFRKVANDLRALLDGSVVVHHQYQARKAILSKCKSQNIEPPQCRWLDSCKAARRTWVEVSKSGYSDVNVANLLGITYGDGAAAAAEVAGRILVAAMRDGESLEDMEEIVTKPGRNRLRPFRP